MGKIGRTYPNTYYSGGRYEHSNAAGSTRSFLGPADLPGAFEPANHTIAGGVIGLLVVLGLIGWLLTVWAS